METHSTLFLVSIGMLCLNVLPMMVNAEIEYKVSKNKGSLEGVIGLAGYLVLFIIHLALFITSGITMAVTIYYTGVREILYVVVPVMIGSGFVLWKVYKQLK